MTSPAPERTLTEGEAWSREQLELLLAARFSPAGVVRFLVASQRRAAQVRARRPELGRQSRVWLVAGGCAWALPALAGVEPFRRQARAGMGWWSVTALMLDWHLGMVETEDGRPRRLGPADALTLARVWLAPVALSAPTALVCAAGFATDLLDGPLARRTEPTRAGRDLEGLADMCFASALLAGLRRRDAIGSAASAAELIRLGTGLGASVAWYFGRAEAPERALVRAARVTTPVRAAGLLAACRGHRRVGTALVGAGCAASVGLVGRALMSRAR